MTTRTIGIVIDGATGRLGTTQHLRALLEMRREGGLTLKRRPADAGAGAARPRRGKTRGAGREEAAASNGAPTATPASPTRRSTSISTPAPPAAGPSASAPRSPPASTSMSKSRRRKPGRCAEPGPRRRARRQKGRRRAGQTVPARPQETAPTLRGRILRPGPVGAARFRLVGVRRRVDPGAAPELELPQGDRRRADPRYVRALALHLRPAARPDHRRLVPSHDVAAAPHRRDRPALRCRCRGPRLRAVRTRRRRLGADLSSWANRVKRDDLLQIQVDGTAGSAVAGLHRCFIQPRSRRRARFSARKCRRR